MRTLSEKQQKQRQRQMEAQERRRWIFTAVFAFDGFVNAETVFEKRSQLAHLFSPVSSSGFPIWHHLWINIFNAVIAPVLVVQLWARIHAHRREQLAAEQEALRKAAPPTEGIWPPPPRPPV